MGSVFRITRKALPVRFYEWYPPGTLNRFQTLIDGLSFTESPRWYEGRLYFSDFYTHRVIAITMDGTPETIAHIPAHPSGLGFLPNGEMLIVSMRDRRILRRKHDGTLVQHADVSRLATWHLNDMLVDAEGRAWAGNFGFDLHGGAELCKTVLISVEPDGTAAVAARELGFPNGMAITPDGNTLILAETTMSRLSAFSVSQGKLGRRRDWASFGPVPKATTGKELLSEVPVAPDGICLDAEGAVWVADPPHSRLLRVQEGGRILQELSADSHVFACMLGGDDGRTLFVCAAKAIDERELVKHHQASIIATTVDVPRAGLP